MTEEQYERWSAPWRARPRLTRTLLAANKLLTALGYAAYPLLIALLALAALGGEDVIEARDADAEIGTPTTSQTTSAGAEGTGAAIGAPATSQTASAETTDTVHALNLLARCIAVPAVGFAAVSLFRRRHNAPRPYEALDIHPLIEKNTRGKSFPSRHVFSMFMIAFSWMTWQPVVGATLTLAGALMAYIRVIGGVHFPRDVLAGALAALAVAPIGYVMVP